MVDDELIGRRITRDAHGYLCRYYWQPWRGWYKARLREGSILVRSCSRVLGRSRWTFTAHYWSD